jgi:Arc/MetJ family transcription regulator
MRITVTGLSDQGPTPPIRVYYKEGTVARGIPFEYSGAKWVKSEPTGSTWDLNTSAEVVDLMVRNDMFEPFIFMVKSEERAIPPSQTEIDLDDVLTQTVIIAVSAVTGVSTAVVTVVVVYVKKKARSDTSSGSVTAQADTPADGDAKNGTVIDEPLQPEVTV